MVIRIRLILTELRLIIRNWKVIVQHETLANFYERIEIGVAGSPSMMLHFLPDVE